MNKKLLAFTLIELLVVIAIIGILSGLIVITMGGMTEKATIAKSQVFSNSLRNALMINMVSEWKLDGNTDDSWSGGNNGTWSGSAGGDNTSANYRPSSECVSGQCLDFDGTDDYVYVSGSDSASSPLAITGAITLSAWVKFATISSSQQTIAGRGMWNWAAGSAYGYGVGLGTDRKINFITFSSTVRDVLSSVNTINDLNWHLITATWDGTTNANTKKIYLDGAPDNQITSTISAIGQSSTYQFRIGATGGGTIPLNGSIDDVRVYSAAVPASQIEEQYYAGLNVLLSNNQITKNEYLSRIKMLSFK